MATESAIRRRKAFRAGLEHGRAKGSWVIDGNTSDEEKARIIKGYEEGDPEIMDMCPDPLSGEWAGESMSELSKEYGIDLYDEDQADDFETAFQEAFWVEVMKDATA